MFILLQIGVAEKHQMLTQNEHHSCLQITFACELTVFREKKKTPTDTFTYKPPTSCNTYTLQTNNEQDENESNNRKKGAGTKKKNR